MYILMNKLYILILSYFFLQACSTKYVEGNKKFKEYNNPLQSKVYYNLSKDYNKKAPKCIIIIPIKSDINKKDFFVGLHNIGIDKIIRKSIYAHLSSYNYRDVELNRIDYLIKKNKYHDLDAFNLLSKELDCDSVLEIEINNFSYTYLGLYSSINIDIDIRLISSNNNEVLWEASLIDTKAKGSFPLSPFSIASGLYSATNNLKEESIYAVADNISRKLLKTLPDPQFKLVEDNLDFNNSSRDEIKIVKKISNSKLIENHKSFQEFVTKDNYNMDELDKVYIKLNTSKGPNKKSTYMYSELLFVNGYYEKAVETISNFELLEKPNANINFLKGKIFYNMKKYKEAERNFILAINKNPESAIYYNSLGVLYIKQNKVPLANAAFTEALKKAPNNMQANKIMGIINFNLKNFTEAVFYFSNSAITSYENNDYENLAKNIILLEKIKKIDPNSVDAEIMGKFYFALEGRKEKK